MINIREFKYTNEFEEKLAEMCEGYCESLTDQEFEWLVSGLSKKLKEYIKHQIDIL